jgi:diguanylate cyclase (GGDEF)-like protein
MGDNTRIEPCAPDTPAGAPAAGELSTALFQIAASAQAALGADRVTCYSWSVTKRVVEAMYTTEDDPRRRERLEYSIGRSGRELPLAQALIDARPMLIVSDAANDARIPPALAERVGARALIAVILEHDSIRVDDTHPILGALFCTFASPRAFTAQETATARGLALVASLALAHAHLRMETARSLARMRDLEAEQAALRRVATAVAVDDGAGADIHRSTAEEAARLLGVATALVVRFDGDEAVVVGTAGGAVPPGRRLPAVGDGVLARVAATGRAVEMADYEALPADSPSRQMAAHLGYRTVAAAPITVDDHLWGTLVAAARHPGDMPHDGAERLARFAELVAIAIANAETRRRLVEQSTRDPLTGLANHRAFFDRLDSEVERSRRRDRPLSIVIIDLDDFKRVNDRFGHLAGDRVLVEFARRLGEQARAEDTLGRIGGEEFAWLIPEADAAQAVSAAERARRVIADAPFDHAGRVTMSAGVAQIVTGMDARALVAVADAALYRAKAAGRNRTVAAPIS